MVHPLPLHIRLGQPQPKLGQHQTTTQHRTIKDYQTTIGGSSEDGAEEEGVVGGPGVASPTTSLYFVIISRVSEGP